MANRKRVCKITKEIEADYPFIKKTKVNGSTVFCSICSSNFAMASGRYDIKRHLDTDKHKKILQSAAGTSNLVNFFKPAEMGSTEKNIALAEAVFTFHTINHHQSFRSMDCTSKVIRTLFQNKFFCARTKSEAIVKNVLMPHVLEKLTSSLMRTNFVAVYTDASNHKDKKMFPIVVRFFDELEGVQVKLLEFSTLPGETSELISDYLYTTLRSHNIDSKLVALCADNTNTNFGGAQRKGTKNVLAKINAKLAQNVIGIGCAAHIINNAIRTAADLMPLDIESIIKKIYSYFYIYTVRVEELKLFCNEVDVEYKRLLGYSETRWLALMPSIERVLQMFLPLKSYFLSLEKCPVAIRSFFENEASEVWLKFLHNMASVFHGTIKTIEQETLNVMEVAEILKNLKNKLQERITSEYLPLVLKDDLSKLEEAGQIQKRWFLAHVLNFYSTSFKYIDHWTEQFNHVSQFNWVLLKSAIVWDEVQQNLNYLNTQFPNHNINENDLFDEISCLKNYATDNKLRNWNDEKISADLRWVEIFSHFKNCNISHQNCKKIVEYTLCLPGTNAATERIFSVVNKLWTVEKSQLSVETIKAILTVRSTYSSCQHFLEEISQNNNLLKKIHSSEKYL